MKLYRKRALSQFFSYDFCKNVWSSYFQEHLGMTVSEGITYKTKSESEWSHGQLY